MYVLLRYKLMLKCLFYNKSCDELRKIRFEIHIEFCV